jgi:hypothetical protein
MTNVIGFNETISYTGQQGVVGVPVSYTQYINQALPDVVVPGSPTEPVRAVFEIPNSTNIEIGTDISASAADNSFNTDGTVTDFTEFDKGDWITVTGFTKFPQNNRDYQISKTIAPTATKIRLEGENLLLEEVAGPSVTIQVINTGRLSTGNFGETASAWIPSLRTWKAAGTKVDVDAALAGMSFLPENQAGNLEIDGRIFDANDVLIESTTFVMQGNRVSLPIISFTATNPLSGTSLIVACDVPLSSIIELAVTYTNTSKTLRADVTFIDSDGNTITNGSAGSFLTGDFGAGRSAFSSGVLSFFGENDEVKAFLGCIRWVTPSSFTFPFNICVTLTANDETEVLCFDVPACVAGTAETILYYGVEGEVQVSETDNPPQTISVTEQPAIVQVIQLGGPETITITGEEGEDQYQFLGSFETIIFTDQPAVFPLAVGEAETITFSGQPANIADVNFGSLETITYTGQPELVEPTALGLPVTIEYNEGPGIAYNVELIATAQYNVEAVPVFVIMVTDDVLDEWVFVDETLVEPNGILRVGSNWVASLLTTGDAIKTSIGGTVWTSPSTPPTDVNLLSLHSDGSTTAAAGSDSGGGDGRLFTASDVTTTWTENTNYNTVFAVVFDLSDDGTNWVIVGQDPGPTVIPVLVHTTDITSTFTNVTDFNTLEGFLHDVKYDGSNWVATGHSNDNNAGILATATDPTGTWTIDDNWFIDPNASQFGDGPMLAYGGGIWAIIDANSGDIATATDPTGTWTFTGLTPPSGLESIYTDGTVWILGLSNGQMYSSTDPTTDTGWTITDTPLVGQDSPQIWEITGI